MKRLMKKLLLALLMSLCFISVSQAQSMLTPAAVPKNLHVYNKAGNTYVDTIATECSGVRYILEPTHAKYNAVFSLLLAAQMGGKKVSLKFSECNNIPQGIIEGVYLVE